MKQNLETALKAQYQSEQLSQHSEQEALVLAKIQSFQQQRTTQKQIIFGLISAVSFALAAVLLVVFQQQAANSGLWEFVATAFSDLRHVGLYWSDFMLLIGESLPVPILAGELLIFAVGLVAGRSFLRLKQQRHHHFQIS